MCFLFYILCSKITPSVSKIILLLHGGTTDLSGRHETPVVISSRELRRFYMTFEYMNPSENKKAQERRPDGLYTLTLEQAGEGARFFMEWDDRYGERRETEFMADASALADLEALLRDHDVAQIDGHAKRNTALGDNMLLEAVYASGESIRAVGEGGGVKPAPRYYQEEWLIDFFRDLARACGHDILSPRLVSCIYRVAGGMGGGHYELRLEKTGQGARLTVTDKESNGEPERSRTIDVPGETLLELTALAGQWDLMAWRDLPQDELQALDAPTRSLGVTYSSGDSAWISMDQVLPPEGPEAILTIRRFLLGLAGEG